MLIFSSICDIISILFFTDMIFGKEEIAMGLDKEKLIANMTKNLIMLRTCLGFTQEELANKIGLSRSTIMAIENNRSKMTWTVFLALMLLFSKHEETDKLLNVLEIYTEDFNRFIKDM